MRVFLVRHGETGGNVARRHQAEHTALTPKGLAQARAVAALLKELQPTHLISSTMVRAIETARVIGESCDLVPELHPAFIELRRPSRLYGHYQRSFQSLLHYAEWYFGINDRLLPDGESYKMLRERIKTAQEYLATFPPDATVVVVSHSVFINMFLAHMCNSKALGPLSATRTFLNVVTMPNTKLTPLQFSHEVASYGCPWSLDKDLASSLKSGSISADQ